MRAFWKIKRSEDGSDLVLNCSRRSIRKVRLYYRVGIEDIVIGSHNVEISGVVQLLEIVVSDSKTMMDDL